MQMLKQGMLYMLLTGTIAVAIGGCQSAAGEKPIMQREEVASSQEAEGTGQPESIDSGTGATQPESKGDESKEPEPGTGTEPAKTGPSTPATPSSTPQIPSESPGTNQQAPSGSKGTNAPISIVEGVYKVAGGSPLWFGEAVITKKKQGLYRLEVNIMTGLSHHIGSIESDFTVQGGVVELTDEQYKAVTVTVEDNRLEIDYPESESFGGANAEPKGYFYLFQSAAEDTPFQKKLYDAVQMEETYREGFTDVLTIYSEEGKQLLLLQSHSTIHRDVIVSEYLVQYDERKKSFLNIGEIGPGGERAKLSKALKRLGYDDDMIYEATRKAEFDRYQEVLMERFDENMTNMDAPLTEEEAFYVAMGIDGKTRAENNTRDEHNIGSIFIQELDSSNDKTVTIHIYELVRNSDDDEHTATGAWLEVDRATGKVTDMLDDL